MDAEGERLLRDLDDAQRHAVTVEASPLCILAGPGSGKTRVLTRRVAWRCHVGTAVPRHTVVLTFTRAAAVELRARFALLGLGEVTTGTFHSVCLALLVRRYRETGRRPPVVARSRQRILSDVLAAEGELQVTARQLHAELGWAAANMSPSSRYPAAIADAGRTTIHTERLAELMAAYEVAKHARGVIDLDDLLALVVTELEGEPRWADGQRWLWRHLLVDEYQDTSLPQRRLLQLLGTGGDLCLVGDPRQCIFAFAGVDPLAMASVSREFPGTVTVGLPTNHRSTARIVAAANALIEGQLSVDGEDPGPPITVTEHETDADEALAISRQLRLLGAPWSRRAVLARTNAGLDLVEAGCLANGIPTTRSQDLLQRPETRAVLAWLRRLPRRTGAAGIRGDLAEICAEVLEGMASAEGDPDDPERSESLAIRLARHHLGELEDLVGEFRRLVPAGFVEDLLFWLEAHAGGPGASRPVPHAVELRTIHAAKGLEWETVFLAGCEKDLMPLKGADPEEERRLAYVAVTRAASALHCSWARRRTGTDGLVRERHPSPILGVIRAAAAGVADPPVLSDAAASAYLASVRARLAAAAPVQPVPRVRRSPLGPMDGTFPPGRPCVAGASECLLGS